jgi:hypothetical protein
MIDSSAKCHLQLFFLMGMLFFSISCASGYDSELLMRARKQFDAYAAELSLEKNASIRYKNLGAQLSVFPDAMQSMEEICDRGLPRNRQHLRKWLEKNKSILKNLQKIIMMENYRLRYDDLMQGERLEKIIQLSSLLLVHGAFLLEEGQADSALKEGLRVFRICNHLTQDGISQDFDVAFLIHRRATHLIRRILPHVKNTFLKECIVEVERDLRSRGTLKNLYRTLKRLSPAHLQEWLKPNEADTFWERLSQPSRQTLARQVEEVFQEQQKYDKFTLKDLIQEGKWEKLGEILNSSNFYVKRFFNFYEYEDGLKLRSTNYLRTRVNLAYMKIRDEMIEMQAAALMLRRDRKHFPDRLEEIIQEILLAHHLRGKIYFSGQERAAAFIDVFSGKPYGFRHENETVTFWSWGPDFRNDAGLESWDGKKGDLLVKCR